MSETFIPEYGTTNKLPRGDSLFNCMMALVAAFVIIAGVWSNFKSAHHIPTIPKASSTVYIDIDGKGHCSGVYLGNNLVLTAAHCAGDKLTVETDLGFKAEAPTLWVNKDYDLMLISFDPHGGVASAHLACRKPIEGERVTASGNPRWARFLKTYGYVAGADRQVGDTNVLTPLDITMLPGMSGGPVFDAAGDIIGINDAVMVSPIQAGPFSAGVATGIAFMVPSYVACRLMGEGRS